MKTNAEGIKLIQSFEGCRLKAYKAVPTEAYYTIGWGHYGPDVLYGMTISQERADQMLKEDLAKYERAVTNLGMGFGENQFSALVSFAYNCGVGNLRLLTKNRTKAQIADAIPLYNKAGGKVLAGLTRRRAAEKALYLKDPQKSIADIAREVLDGAWGNGIDRKNRLHAAGYDYAAVQKEVNRLVRAEP